MASLGRSERVIGSFFLSQHGDHEFSFILMILIFSQLLIF